MATYTVNEVAKLKDVNPETVRRWIRSGELKAIKNSNKNGYIIREEDLKRFNDLDIGIDEFALAQMNYRVTLENMLRDMELQRDKLNIEIDRIQKLLSIF